MGENREGTGRNGAKKNNNNTTKTVGRGWNEIRRDCTVSNGTSDILSSFLVLRGPEHLPHTRSDAGTSIGWYKMLMLGQDAKSMGYTWIDSIIV